MKMPNAKDISNIIDTCYMGVSESTIGPIPIPNPSNLQEKKYAQIPLSLFMNVTNSALNEYFKSLNTKEPA